MPRDADGLNAKQAAFKREYLKDHKGGPALIRAGYSPNGADQTACALLRTPKMKAAIAKAEAKLAAKAEITQEMILADLGEDRVFARKVKQAGPAVKATEVKAKMLGFLKDRVEVTGDLLPSLIIRILGRPEGEE